MPAALWVPQSALARLCLQVGDNITAYNNYERTFMVLVLLGGALMYSAVVGQMAILVATLNVATNRHG